MNKFLTVKNLTTDSADIYFYGDIVSSEWGKWENTDTAPEDVREQLAQVENAKNLNIYINSNGGSVFAGLAIYNMLKRHKAHKTVYVDGVAASIASVIAMAGDKIVMPSNAFLMIHKPLVGIVGNSNDFRQMADDLDVIESGLINVYEENLAEGANIEDIKNLMNKDTWFNGKEAANYFNIEVSTANNVAAYNTEYLNMYNNVPSTLSVESVNNPAAHSKSDEDEQKKEIENVLFELDLF